jgi:hypothetical protein
MKPFILGQSDIKITDEDIKNGINPHKFRPYEHYRCVPLILPPWAKVCDGCGEIIIFDDECISEWFETKEAFIQCPNCSFKNIIR